MKEETSEKDAIIHDKEEEASGVKRSCKGGGDAQ